MRAVMCWMRTLTISVVAASLLVPLPAHAAPSPGQEPTLLEQMNQESAGTEVDSLYESNESFKPSDRPSDGGGNLDGGEGYALRRLEEGVRIGRQAGPGNNFGDSSDSLFSNFNNPGIGQLTGPNTWCMDAEGKPKDCVVESEAQLKTAPGKKSNPFNFLSPMGGVTDTLHSKAYVDQITGNLSSPLAVLSSTISLTEPGLARGMMDSMQMAGMATNSRLLADQAVFSRAQLYRGSAEVLASAYDAKMARERAAGKSWIEAQSGALGGERNTFGGNGSPTPFNALSGGILDFKGDPNHPRQNPEASLGDNYYDGSQIKDNVIRGLDFVFNRELTFPSGEAPANHKEAMKKLRRSFERYIGDVEIRIGTSDPNLAPTDPAGNAQPADGATVMEVRRIAPQENPQVFFRSLVIDRYKDIHTLLALRCKHDHRATESGNTNDLAEISTEEDGEFMKPGTAKVNFWADIGGAHQLLTRISTAGFSPHPKLIEALYAKFRNESGGGGDEVKCSDLSTERGKPSDIFTLLTEKNQNERGRALATNSKERIQAAFFLAEHIAYGQFLGTLAQAQNFLSKSSNGGYESLIKENLSNAILDTAGTPDITLAMERNAQELRAITNEIGNWYMIQNVESSAPLSQSFAEGGGTKGSINNTTGQ